MLKELHLFLIMKGSCYLFFRYTVSLIGGYEITHHVIKKVNTIGNLYAMLLCVLLARKTYTSVDTLPMQSLKILLFTPGCNDSNSLNSQYDVEFLLLKPKWFLFPQLSPNCGPIEKTTNQPTQKTHTKTSYPVASVWENFTPCLQVKRNTFFPNSPAGATFKLKS